MIGKRDNEIGFKISSLGYVEKYIGREVSTSTIEEVFNRELTDEEIDKNTNLFVIDNLLCSQCESKLGVLEGSCAVDFKSTFCQKSNCEILTYQNGLQFRILFYSILLRLHYSNKHNCNLNPVLARRLKRLINKTLSSEKKELLNNLSKYRSEIETFPMSVFYAPMLEGESSGNMIYTHNDVSIPCVSMINEFIVCLYCTNTQTQFDFGEVYSIDKTQILSNINYRESEFRIKQIDDRNIINASLLKDSAHEMHLNLRSNYCQIFKKVRKENPSNQQVKDFMNDLVNDDESGLNKYTIPNLAKVMHRHLIS
ncbi:hypothetical protein N7E81_14680 [Reichenbachiella carrageenanivorans]|uniref:Uncharacterized protein n=1 Tax=Reichenbachiella carrageenanivorans TaxID=2979869 RepID=A0ABY6CYX4_9BACT|nr:hypothetical protein [Reichenbachiella carrageenanivorans]UXX78604.1 hypothetical protein N7E81_14680 [Reichenbachiella carrageenanivorans]